MFPSPIRVSGLALLAGFFLSASASASVILSNLPQAGGTGSGTVIRDTSVKAIAFQMDAGSNYTLDSVALRLSEGSGSSPVVQIRNDGGANPGSTVLADFVTSATLGSAPDNYTFTPTSPSVTLQAGATYWLYVTNASAALFVWAGSAQLFSATDVASVKAQRLSSDDGASYGDSIVVNAFAINGTEITAPAVGTVPEPSTLALLVPAAALALRRRLRAGHPSIPQRSTT